jgi:hypothetical protein
MLRSLAVLLAVVMTACSSIDSLFSPGADPLPGDVERSSEFRARLQTLIAQEADASFVRFDIGKLLGWEARSIAVTKETYEGKTSYGKYGLPAGLPEDLFGIHCGDELRPPFVYTNYHERGDYWRLKRSSTFLEGSCSELKQNKNRLMVGVYSFSTPLSATVPSGERSQRLESALAWPQTSSLTQTDRRISEFPSALIGEAAGYTYEHTTIFLHASRQKKTGNYYRLMLVGNRTMVSVVVYGPRSQSVQDMQAVIWPVLQSLSWSR